MLLGYLQVINDLHCNVGLGDRKVLSLSLK
jgi:hypothetical protein